MIRLYKGRKIVEKRRAKFANDNYTETVIENIHNLSN